MIGRDPGDVFTTIFRSNAWGDSDSVSGSGSNLAATLNLRKELPGVLERLAVLSLFDAPCGDFHWMSQVDLPGVAYIGADIVEPLIDSVRQAHGNATREFRIANLLLDPVPCVDMVLSRDCLVHLSFQDAFRSLANFRDSGSLYLATTTFVNCRRNSDIVTGQWRPLNFRLPPFSFPEPLYTIIEDSGPPGGRYSDKALAFWDLQALDFG